MIKRLLRFWDDLNGYPSQHIHKHTQLWPVQHFPSDIGHPYFQRFMCVCQVCGYMEEVR